MIMFDWGMMERIPQPYLRAAAAMGGKSLKSKWKRGWGIGIGPCFLRNCETELKMLWAKAGDDSDKVPDSWANAEITDSPFS